MQTVQQQHPLGSFWRNIFYWAASAHCIFFGFFISAQCFSQVNMAPVPLGNITQTNSNDIFFGGEGGLWVEDGTLPYSAFKWIIYLKILQNISIQTVLIAAHRRLRRIYHIGWCCLYVKITWYVGQTAFLSIHLISKIVYCVTLIDTTQPAPSSPFLNPLSLFSHLFCHPLPSWPLFLLLPHLLASCLMEVFPCSLQAAYCYSAQVGLISCSTIISHWQQFGAG